MWITQISKNNLQQKSNSLFRFVFEKFPLNAQFYVTRFNQIIQLSATNSVPQNGLNGGPNAERGETKPDRRIDVAFIFKCPVNSSRVGISKSEFRIKMAAA